jgi:hypothetical protein
MQMICTPILRAHLCTGQFLASKIVLGMLPFWRELSLTNYQAKVNKVYKNTYELSQDIKKRYLVYTQFLLVAQTLKPPPLLYAKPRVSIAFPPATTIPNQAPPRYQLSVKEYNEYDATFKKGDTDKDMGKGPKVCMFVMFQER